MESPEYNNPRLFQAGVLASSGSCRRQELTQLVAPARIRLRDWDIQLDPEARRLRTAFGSYR